MTEYDYGPALREISKSISVMFDEIRDVERSVDRLTGDVGTVQRDLNSTHEDLRKLRAAFNEFVAQTERNAAIQRAETKLGNLKDELDRQFGHYAVVRRTSIGTLQAFDVGNVSDAAVTRISEELMIQSPRYWLAPALVGLAAWSRDDEEIASKSIAEAFKRDAAKTSLFFALVLRRMGRSEAATRWLKHYLSSQSSTGLTREFAVILESAAQGAFGPGGAQLLSSQLRDWNIGLRLDDAVVTAQVDEWVEEIRNNALELDAHEYKELQELSPDFRALANLLSAASALGATAEKYRGIRESTPKTSALAADMLDDLLEQLVTEYDAEELPLQREVAFNQAVLDTNGDLVRAKSLSDQYTRALEETIDAVTLQTRTAISPSLMGVSEQTQRVSIGAGQADFIAAVKQYTRGYRENAKTSARIYMGPDHCPLAEQLGFSKYETTTAVDETDALVGLQRVWEETVAGLVEEHTFRLNKFGFPIGLAVAVAIIAFAINPLFGLLVALGGGGGLYYWINQKKTDSEKKIREVRSTQSVAYEQSKSVLIDARAAFTDMMYEYHELDSEESALVQLIETWPTATSKGESDDEI